MRAAPVIITALAGSALAVPATHRGQEGLETSSISERRRACNKPAADGQSKCFAESCGKQDPYAPECADHKRYIQCMMPVRDANMKCLLDRSRAKTTAWAAHERCSSEAVSGFRACRNEGAIVDRLWLECSARTVDAYEQCVQAVPATTSADMAASESVERPFGNDRQLRNQTIREPIWAEREPRNKEFADCEAKLPGNKCVRDFFHLQGSVGRFVMNCNVGDLQNRKSPHRILLSNYPSSMFPEGPECGTVNGTVVVLTKDDYEPICNACFKTSKSSSRRCGRPGNPTAGRA
ncbi:uncharacterized protein MAM_04110 [Metarhizium album ARSEF 1941]|uniref:Uncharacterized protein n=1 Tax=Metarhizium album (strain ARSEF 1941) TaxID=1081103 RepID=A0A0B2WNU8_METAS|nr:uncharacterized protein MAM_04110 [Metarhizium album ARSEF 1941]KHN97721.1 hypothetical protein MAM_04110 [Metarhizium album ARSEF 1941]